MRNARLALTLLPVAGCMLTACATGTTVSSSAPATSGPTPTKTATSVHVASSGAAEVSPPTSITAQQTCQQQTMKASPASKTANSAGTFTVSVAVKNSGTSPCVIQGYPTVAITGLPPATGDWPRRQLTVTQHGPAYPVTLVPGDGSFVDLTFHQCAAGQNGTQGPVMLLGVPTGGIEVSLEDGSDFVECGDTVTASAFQEHMP